MHRCREPVSPEAMATFGAGKLCDDARRASAGVNHYRGPDAERDRDERNRVCGCDSSAPKRMSMSVTLPSS